LLVAEVGGASVDFALSVLDARVHALDLEVEVAEFFGLVVWLDDLAFVQFLEAGDFTPHLSALNLDGLNFALEVALLLTEVSNHGFLWNGLVTETTSLEVLFVEDFFAAGLLFVKVNILARLLLEQVLEVIKLLAGVGDLVSSSVETVAVLVLGAGLVVAEHAVAVLHGENFVVDAAVVAVLVAEVVELLSELGDELIFLGGANFDTGFLGG
jgi:hypothetical protein